MQATTSSPGPLSPSLSSLTPERAASVSSGSDPRRKLPRVGLGSEKPLAHSLRDETSNDHHCSRSLSVSTPPQLGLFLSASTWEERVAAGLQPHSNDPSAGSPTETLLRLLLPLNDQVWTSFRLVMASPPPPIAGVVASGAQSKTASPKASLNHSIGSSDGRCVQRAGT